MFLELILGSQIRQIWRILHQNCSDDSTEVTEGVMSTPEIFGNKQGATPIMSIPLDSVYMPGRRAGKSEKMALFVVILDSKYSKMTPKFVKQKSH